MGVSQDRAPWRSCGSRPSRTWSETAPEDRPASRRAGCDPHNRQRDGRCLLGVGAVGEQAALSGNLRWRIDRRYLVSGRRRYDRRAMHGREYIRYDDKAASGLMPKGDDGHFNFYVAMNGRTDWHNLERPGRRLK